MKKSGKAAASFTTDQERWRALECRDATADGRFVYAVRTTGVYCRPVCSARLALRRNISFYDTCAGAEQAGYRPCQRCRPHDKPLRERHADAAVNACRLLETSETVPSLDLLAEAAGLSRFHFLRVFKQVIGVTPSQYARARRDERARLELRNRDSVTEALYCAGFNSSGRFYERTNAALGMRPADFKKWGRGTLIRFAVARCSLGHLLVAGTDRGICAVSIGPDAAALEDELRRNFRLARIEPGEAHLSGWLGAVLASIDHGAVSSSVPLDIRGTAFQSLVWNALRSIPAGETVSYTALAGQIGRPGSARAVARACASNQVAVLVPCHRVVRSDGGLSGYRWGTERKRELLAREKARKVRGGQ